MASILEYLRPSSWGKPEPQPIAIGNGPELRAYELSPSESFRSWMTELLGGGPGASLAHQNFAEGLPKLLEMTPLGIGLSLADFANARKQNDLKGAAAAALGMVPGVKPELTAARQGIRAYHGSPHDFDKFDISKIGTGEGAQAYGHGLYFAENEKVAKEYRDALTRAIPVSNGRIRGRGDGKFDIVDDFGVQGGPFNSRAEAEEAMRGGGGKMYEVNINADPSHFLDWDRSLRDQSPYVQNVFEQIGIPVHRKTKEDPQAGSDLYWWLNSDKAGASRELKDAGIPGIRYLDQGSRPAALLHTQLLQDLETYKKLGNKSAIESIEQQLANPPQGTSNYVLFNDSIIDIVRKYGLAGLFPTTMALPLLQNAEDKSQ